MQTYRHGSEPFSLQRRNLKGGTKALEGWGFRNETDPLTDVLLGSPAHLRHLSTSSLSRKHLREAPCNVQVGQAQHAVERGANLMAHLGQKQPFGTFRLLGATQLLGQFLGSL